MTMMMITEKQTFFTKKTPINEKSRHHFICLHYAQSPLHTFPRNFPVDGEAANLQCYRLVADLLRETGVMDFGLY